MGAPKQKWTSEEESALKAGVDKHGSGNWRTILRDPEFSGILFLRSNVDLKDKWRNMRVTANGWGSREKARVGLKKFRVLPERDDNLLAMSTLEEHDEFVDYKPLTMSSEIMRITGRKRSVMKIEDLIMEAITFFKEPKGSNKTAIASYIEDQYMAPADFRVLLSANLKAMTASGKLFKVKRKYRISPCSSIPGWRKSQVLPLEVNRREPLKIDTNDAMRKPKGQIDVELARVKNMTAQEAAASAAQAIAEAEKAITEAEEAAREADAAEIDAEAAQTFAEAAMLSLKSRNTSKLHLAWEMCFEVTVNHLLTSIEWAISIANGNLKTDQENDVGNVLCA
ncbi:Telomere repeat-binding factor 1 [Apostasia shenzhenica]|uniref:Telomere repeat-binding factor 1 n=1 Tax=Apostasia shenzhenica TaxID=1088818 RepID=A0A2I0A0K4_9ASPA|nr:Telomere repeat-binding factor 1 [Apostasia shenzhenica]